MGKLRRPQYLRLGGVRPGGADVVADALLKQAYLLKDKGDLLHQLRGGDAAHIPSAQEHCPCLHIEKARDQPGDGGFAAAGGSHQRPRLPLRQMEAHIRQRGPVRAVIGKGDILKGNAAVRGLASVVRRRLGQGRLPEYRIQLVHCLGGLHLCVDRVHQPLHHKGKLGREEDVKHQIGQHCPAVCRAADENHSQGHEKQEHGVQHHRKQGVGHTAHHGVAAGKVAVAEDGGMKALEGVNRLLEHLHHRDAPDILRGLGGNALSGTLVFLKELHAGARHHGHQADKPDNHGDQAGEPHAPVKDKEQPHRQCRRYDPAHRVGDGMGKERFCQCRVVVDLLAQPPRKVDVKVPQRQVNEMSGRRLSHICRHPEGRKVRTHEPGEIDRRAQKRRRQRIPAVAGKPCRNAAPRR